MVRLRLKTFAILLGILIPSFAIAKAPKGFHEGPYLRIIGGVNRIAFDNNARTGEKTANDYEGVYGFHFGWNVFDSLAPELEIRYATKQIRDSREHSVNVNLNVKYAFVTDALTNIAGGLHILPYVQGGPTALLAVVPGDSESNDDIMAVWGGGAGGGVGVDFLVYKYIYFSILLQADVYYIPAVYQVVGGVSQKIIAGGWEPMFGLIGAAGVHF